MDKATIRISSRLTASHRPLLYPSRIPSAYRTFTASRIYKSNQDKEPFRTRLATAWRNTRIQWYTIPVGAGIAFLGATQLYKSSKRENARIQEERDAAYASNGGNGDHDHEPEKRKKRKRIRPSGPWSVQLPDLDQ
jgi:phosphatidylserine decarboxylase